MPLFGGLTWWLLSGMSEGEVAMMSGGMGAMGMAGMGAGAMGFGGAMPGAYNNDSSAYSERDRIGGHSGSRYDHQSDD